MARYRKIDVRIWSDEKFRRLSAPKPNAQTLWFFLLTNRFTTNIPGLYSAGEAALAEEIGWPLVGFRAAFREVQREGMAEADWTARVVWVPKAIRYHDPESPNVVKNWRVAFDEIPDCALKASAFLILEAHVQRMHQGFYEAFAETFRRGFAEHAEKASVETRPIQEQEQEQEQKQEKKNSVALPVFTTPLVELEADWDPKLLQRVKRAVSGTRKSGNMAEGPWRSFLLSAQQFTRELRERAASEYLDRAYAAEGKGEKYLLGIMRGENGRAQLPMRNGSTQLCPPNLRVDNDALNAEPNGRKML